MKNEIKLSAIKFKQNRRDTSFGNMWMHGSNGAVIEIMHFKEEGRSHHHQDEDEIAICVSGSGMIFADRKIYVESGDIVRIPAGVDHFMKPDGEMHMVIMYEEPTMEWLKAYRHQAVKLETDSGQDNQEEQNN